MWTYAIHVGAGIVASVLSSTAATAYTTQLWNGYHWARTGELSVALGDNVSKSWKPFFTTAARQWSLAKIVDFAATTGSTAPSTCNPIYDSVQVCSDNYGATGWLGYGTVYTGGGFIVEATVKPNDYYFLQPAYHTGAWKGVTACQEIGRTLGLAHNDTIRSDLKKGTCMDYTNDLTGKPEVEMASLRTLLLGNSDFLPLNRIYLYVDITKLTFTKPQFSVSDALSIGQDHEMSVQPLPEAGEWALMLIGFAGIGVTMWRCPRAAMV